jgi:hypothetical protein
MADKDSLPEAVKENVARVFSNKESDALDNILSQEDDYFMPWEDVVLPSKGVYYDNLMPDGIIKVKPMGIDVDKMMANQRIVASGELLNKIIEACVKLPDGMTVNDLLAGDQYFLLYYLRGITHGNDYEFVSDCPSCGTKSTYDYNLSDLSKTIKGPNPDYPVEPMEVELPYISEKTKSSVSAMVRLLRVKDMRDMVRGNVVIDPIKKGKARSRGQSNGISKQSADDIYTKNITTAVIGFKVDGKVFSDDRKDKLIEKLHQKDTVTIREFIDSITPGIDTSVDVTCQNNECNRDYSISLPFGENFFRPSKK